MCLRMAHEAESRVNVHGRRLPRSSLTRANRCRIAWPAQSVFSIDRRAVRRRSSWEGKAELLRLKQDIPLTEAEAAAVEDGVTFGLTP